ncbi:uncharacterized protein EV422DRAFT_44152 [Fimicolochytrium jonesii]|uniref:uncharacterized protein n=1 Tax=Fimicolochytrium jonesii TaxID=1396493 RepID=UPI0022FED6BD|nr:uncharacterized protein EV422DRAFT_44152 [Fimicolochytrium jonesii]KAI8821476.1 hypothetical protein EV422DRAFT_44152 [Fimicolochytrium jonesii]
MAASLPPALQALLRARLLVLGQQTVRPTVRMIPRFRPALRQYETSAANSPGVAYQASDTGAHVRKVARNADSTEALEALRHHLQRNDAERVFSAYRNLRADTGSTGLSQLSTEDYSSIWQAFHEARERSMELHANDYKDLMEDMRAMRLAPNEMQYNAYIIACREDGLLDECLEGWQRMKAEGLQPSFNAYKSILACIRDAVQAREVLKTVVADAGFPVTTLERCALVECPKEAGSGVGVTAGTDNRGLLPDVEMISQVMTTAIGAGEANIAAQAYALAAEIGIKVDGITVANYFDFLAAQSIRVGTVVDKNLVRLSLQVFQSVFTRGIKLNSRQALDVLINGLVTTRDLPSALHVARSAAASGYALLPSTYSRLIHAQVKANSLSGALTVYRDLMLAGSVPNEDTYRYLFQALSRVSFSLSTLTTMKSLYADMQIVGVQGSPPIVEALLTTCSIHADVPTGRKLADDFKVRPLFTKTSFHALLQLAASDEDPVWIRDLHAAMLRRGMQLHGPTLTMVVDAMARTDIAAANEFVRQLLDEQTLSTPVAEAFIRRALVSETPSLAADIYHLLLQADLQIARDLQWSLLPHLVRAGTVATGVAIYNSLRDEPRSLTSDVYNSLMGALLSQGSLIDATKVFRDMLDFKIQLQDNECIAFLQAHLDIQRPSAAKDFAMDIADRSFMTKEVYDFLMEYFMSLGRVNDILDVLVATKGIGLDSGRVLGVTQLGERTYPLIRFYLQGWALPFNQVKATIPTELEELLQRTREVMETIPGARPEDFAGMDRLLAQAWRCRLLHYHGLIEKALETPEREGVRQAIRYLKEMQEELPPSDEMAPHFAMVIRRLIERGNPFQAFGQYQKMRAFGIKNNDETLGLAIKSFLRRKRLDDAYNLYLTEATARYPAPEGAAMLREALRKDDQSGKAKQVGDRLYRLQGKGEPAVEPFWQKVINIEKE